MNFFDAHNHAQDERYQGRNLEILREAAAAGVRAMVVNGSSEQDWPAVQGLARAYPGLIIPSYGYHPWWVQERTGDWETTLLDMLEDETAAVGEIGLDRWKEGLPWDDQEEVFQKQLVMATTYNRPASIHCLKAWGPLLDILEATPLPDCGFLMHSYSGSLELVPRLANLGAYFSFPGYYLHERKQRQRDMFRKIPPDRILIETDAPDQLPPTRVIRFPVTTSNGEALNHPGNIAPIHLAVADMLGIPLGKLTHRLEENFHRLFGDLMDRQK